MTEEYYREVAKGLLELPAVLEDVLGLGDQIADLSKIFTYAHNFIYLGRGYNYPTALEGALKLKEISYIHAEGYPAAEMKHGAIALIDNEMPTVAIATPDNTYEKTASNIEEIRARGGKIIAVIARDDTHVRRSADYTIEVPVVTDCLMPIVVSVPVAAAGILHRRQQGPQRRPAAQPGQVGDGGITSRRKECRSRPCDPPGKRLPNETPAVKEVCGGFSTHNYH